MRLALAALAAAAVVAVGAAPASAAKRSMCSIPTKADVAKVIGPGVLLTLHDAHHCVWTGPGAKTSLALVSRAASPSEFFNHVYDRNPKLNGVGEGAYTLRAAGQIFFYKHGVAYGLAPTGVGIATSARKWKAEIALAKKLAKSL